MKFSVVPLEEVCDFLSGNAWSASDFTEGPEGLPIIRIQNVDSVRESEFVYWNGTFDNRFLVQDGDILLTLSGSFRVVIWAGPRALLNQRIVKLIPKSNIHRDWLLYVVRNRLLQISGLGRHALVSNVALSDLRKLSVPLPPLPEQRRIAAILDQADAVRAKRREALAQLDSLTQSIFFEMFGNPMTNLKAWEVRRLDEVTECLDRLRRPVTESERKPGEIPYYGANGQQGWIDTHLFDESLVLVAEDGGHFDNPSRGVAYRVDGKCWVNNHAHILRPKNSVLDVEYLHRALRHFDFTPYVSGTTRAKLTQGQLNCVPLMVPPITVQRVFADRIHRIELMLNLFRKSMNDLDALFTSLQHRAFAGQLS
jgi:type I restriction enzyme, S subunit